MTGDQVAGVGFYGILIVAILGYLLVEYRGRMGAMARGLIAWGLIIFAVAAGYALWHDIGPTLSPRQSVTREGIALPRARDGHYYATLTIAGTPVQFLVDTGASNVVLTREDAERVGIDLTGLAYVGQAQTANGVVRTARVTLHDVALGDARDDFLPAYVNDGEMDASLLGMDYLGRFRIEIDADRMLLSR